MILKTGNMWDHTGENIIFVVTTNAYINKCGELVMGRGAAKEAKERMPWLPGEAAKQISCVKDSWKSYYKGNYTKKYGFKVICEDDSNGFGIYQRCGIFQVKYHFKDKAHLDLISYSVEHLIEWIWHENSKPHFPNFPIKQYVMNFPGTGYGGLKEEDVLPIISALPDNVIIYQYPEVKTMRILESSRKGYKKNGCV